LLYRGGEWRRLDAEGVILGVTEEFSFEQREVVLREADVLALYTDGVTEAMDTQEELFGEGRLKQVIATNARASSEEIAHAIVQAVTEFAAGESQHDDITLVVLKLTSE